MLTVGSLFAGIGGFDLGLERTGHFRTVWQCEIDPFCQAVLTTHWPEVPKYDDIRQLSATTPGLVRPDVLCGGFPCQDISLAGKGEGIDGSRSGLWAEYARLIGELRPRYVLVENVAALRSRGLDRVLRDLAACGYDAEWDCLPASAVGAPHRRDRIWIVAYPQLARRDGLHERVEQGHMAPDAAWGGGDVTNRRASTDHSRGVQGQGEVGGDAHPHPHRERLTERRERDSHAHEPGQQAPRGDDAGGLRAAVADAHDPRLEGRLLHREGTCELLAGARSRALEGVWRTEPHVGRVAHGVSARVDRLRGLGNAIVPQIATFLGELIVASELESRGVAC